MLFYIVPDNRCINISMFRNILHKNRITWEVCCGVASLSVYRALRLVYIQCISLYSVPGLVSLPSCESLSYFLFLMSFYVYINPIPLFFNFSFLLVFRERKGRRERGKGGTDLSSQLFVHSSADASRALTRDRTCNIGVLRQHSAH